MHTPILKVPTLLKHSQKLSDFSIIMPVLNEADFLEKSIYQMYQKLRLITTKDKWEIILIENGSTDDTWKICQKLRQICPAHIKLIQRSLSSYGLAIKLGIKHAKYKHIFIFNADYWDIQFLVTGLELLKTCDIVVGSKTLIAAHDLRPFVRRQLSYWFNMMLRVIYNFPGTDTHGIKALKASSVRSIVETCYPMHELFDTQIILRACKKGLVYTEVPVMVKEVRPSRYENIRRFTNVINDLITIFKYRYLT